MSNRCLLLIALGTAACAQAEASLPDRPAPDTLPAAAYLSVLPDGPEKRQFIVDCTGCHTFHTGIAYPNGAARSEASWHERTSSMVSRFGAGSGFPVIGALRDPAATARWLTRSLPSPERVQWNWPEGLAGRAELREYAIPSAQDLPHDVAMYGDSVLVTGMFTGQMYVLDPASGAIRTERTPAANPRAVEVGADGSWYVVLGAPRQVARRSPAGEWATFDAGYYAHSVALAADDGLWVNGHFTHRPELISRIDALTGARQDFEVPAHPQLASTAVPYEIRVAPDGGVWLSELQGNRLVRLDPRTGQVKTWNLPTPASGPRRLDIAPDGTVWIPAYGANLLVRFDPRTERFTEYPVPIRDSAPYVVRWDARRGVLWLGTGAADALLRFDPRSEQFRYYRLPTPDALVRHLVVHGRTGDVWLAPGASPGTRPARIIRVRPLD